MAKLIRDSAGVEVYVDFYWCESCQRQVIGDACESNSTPAYCPFCGVKFTEVG